MGILYLVATPIGNLSDITLRALEVLKGVDLILCEDTRHSGVLLAHYEIKKPLLSYQEYNELQRIPEVIEKLKIGQNIALISDAGTPTISDPGFKLVREAIKMGISVISIPGASSILTALTSSGLPTDKFMFLGYLPKKEGHRRELLKNCTLLLFELLESERPRSRRPESQSRRPVTCTLVFFEAPHRLLKTLQEMHDVFGDKEIVICRELTKIHEEIRREKISESITHFQKVNPKGELMILI